MATSIGELVGKIVMDSSGAVTAFTAIENKSKSLENTFKNLEVVGVGILTTLSIATIKFGTDAANEMDIAAAFAQQFGVKSADGLKILQSATKNTIDDYKLMAESNKAAFMGVSTNVNELAGVWEYARARAKSTGEDTTQVFDTLVESIGRGNARIIKTLGIDIPEGFKKTFDSMDLTSQKAILLNSVLQASQSPFNQYQANTVTAADRLRQFTATTEDMGETIGQALIPVLLSAEQAVLPIIKAISTFVQTNPEAVRTFVAVAGSIGGVALAAGVLGRTTMAVSTFFTAVRTGAIASQLALGVLGIALIAVSALFAKAYMDEYNSTQQANDAVPAFNKLGQSGGNAAKAISDGFGGAASKVSDLRKAIDEENKAFDEQVGQIMRTKKEELDNNKQQLAAEQADFEKKQKEEQKMYEDKVKAQQDANQQRLADLETSLGHSLVMGSKTYTEDAANYKAAIEKEKTDNEDKLKALADSHAEEVSNSQAEYDAKTNKLQEAIAADEAFLTKHAEFQSQLNAQEATDEIDKLKEKHAQRLAQINAQYSKELGAFKGLTGGMSSSYDELFKKLSSTDLGSAINIDIGKVLARFGKSIVEIGTSLLKGMTSFMFSAVHTVIGTIISTIDQVPFLKDIADKIGLTAKGNDQMLFKLQARTNSVYANILNPNTTGITDAASAATVAGIPSFADGITNFRGGLANIGERGPETLVLPPGSSVIPNGQAGTTNHNNFYIDRTVDYDTFMQKTAIALRFI